MKTPEEKAYGKKTLRAPWDCPKDCPDRKLGCQNPKTCERARMRLERRLAIRNSKERIRKGE